MKRALVVLVIVALAGVIAAPAYSTDFEAEPITILNPKQETIAPYFGDIPLEWTRHLDTLFYQIVVVLPPDDPRDYDWLGFRYVTDHNWDYLRLNPHMVLDAGMFYTGADHTIMITPYGPAEALIAEFDAPLPRGYSRDLPTDRSFDWYVQLAPTASVTFFVDP